MTAPYSPQLSRVEIALFQKLLDKHNLREHEALIAPWLERCIGMHKDGADDYAQLGNSRLAGLPDLPPDWEWPSRQYEDGEQAVLLSFAGQFNLEELAPYQSLLPRTGMLYVFLDTDPWDSLSCVLYYDGPIARLRRYELDPDGIRLERFDTEMESVEDLSCWYPHKVRFEGTLSIPAYNFRLYHGRFETDFDLGDRYLELQADLEGGVEHCLFGHPFYQGDDPRDLGHPSPEGAPEGITLFAFESDEDLCFSFNGYGSKQLVIAREALARRDFSAIYATEQGT